MTEKLLNCKRNTLKYGLMVMLFLPTLIYATAAILSLKYGLDVREFMGVMIKITLLLPVIGVALDFLAQRKINKLMNGSEFSYDLGWNRITCKHDSKLKFDVNKSLTIRETIDSVLKKEVERKESITAEVQTYWRPS